MRWTTISAACALLTLACDTATPPSADDAGLRDPDPGPGGPDTGGGRQAPPSGDAPAQGRPCGAICERIAECLIEQPTCVEPTPTFAEACRQACPDVEPGAACPSVLDGADAEMGSLTRWCVSADCVDELCNGADDDCDGAVDEADPAIGTACGDGDGECAREGRLRCVAGLLTCDARPGAPGAERCNGRDDDCDGEADEAFPEVGDRCTAGSGACSREGRIVCDAAGGTTCDADRGRAEGEVCNGRDDDCDGRVDEDFPVGQACDEGLGMCLRPGRMRCDGVRAVCDARPGPAQPEVCDGQDGDCDGRVDEGLGGRLVVRNEWPIVPAYSAACNLVLNQVPVMYAAVDCDLDDPRCESAAANGGDFVWYDGPPGRHSLHVRCCQIDGTQCFGQNRRCSLPGSNDEYWCSCIEARAEVNVQQCAESVMVGCAP